MDGELLHAHFDAVLIDLILPEIKEDKLYDEDVIIPETHFVQNENEEESSIVIKEKEDKWQELPTSIAKLR